MKKLAEFLCKHNLILESSFIGGILCFVVRNKKHHQFYVSFIVDEDDPCVEEMLNFYFEPARDAINKALERL